MKHGSIPVIGVALLAALVFLPFLGACPLFDWDEINFAECAREMLVSGDYSHVQLHFLPFWEKPPFFIWMQALSMNIFGVNEFAARFPNAVCSIVTLTCLFVIGRRLHSPRMGFTWALLYASTLLPHLYFRSGLIDPWFNLFIFLAIYRCIRLLNDPHGRHALMHGMLGGLFLGLAVLTKGPAAIVIVGLTLLIFVLQNRSTGLLLTKGFIAFAGFSVLVSCSWFITEIIRGNGEIIREFIDYQVRLFRTGDAGHDGPFFYHLIVLLLGCFPASLIFISSYFRYSELTPFQRLNRKMLLALFWTVLIIFSVVKTKIVHYSSLCYFPLTFIAALALSGERLQPMQRWTKLLYWVTAILISVAVLLITTFHFFRDALLKPGLIKDEFAVMNLQAEVHWNGFEWLLAVLFLAGSYLVFDGIRKDTKKKLYAGTILSLLFVWTSISVIIPKVELYTQHAAVAFYKSVAGRDCYIETKGFKSYAYLFYSQLQPADYAHPDQQQHIDRILDRLESEGHSRLAVFGQARTNWMSHGRIDRPAYIVVKTPSDAELLNTPGMHKLYELNGYSFFVRMPDK